MTRKSLIQRNIKRLHLSKKYEKIRLQYKEKIHNRKKYLLKERFEIQKLLHNLPRNSSKVRIRNRCIITGRSRGIYRIFMISRILIRKMASEGKLPGIIKSSW